jgi:transposase InsO family protein
MSDAPAPTPSDSTAASDAPVSSVPTQAAPALSIPTEQNIVMNIKNLIAAQPVAEGPPRRGFAAQFPRREIELLARRHAVVTSQRLVDEGWTWTAAAEFIGVHERTLRRWRFDPVTKLFVPLPLGRPAHAAAAPERNQVIRFIHTRGPAIGVPALHPEFPQFARAELENILARYRRLWRRRHREQLNELHWAAPGSVWAIDHHGPRVHPVDGRFPYLLAVRDLASGRVLLWLPVSDAAASHVVAAIEMLFIVHGAPLVLKSDNGSAFIAGALRKLCQRFGVKNLFSPPRTPSYNGAIEATIGSLKTRTERHAAHDGRPGYWTTADCDAARHEANTLDRPRGPSPDQAWTNRPRIAQTQRDAFLEAAAHRFDTLAAAQGTLQHDAQHRATDRDAISQVLVELGYLSITRGRSRLPICKKKVAKTR